jgi:hypothetical protein
MRHTLFAALALASGVALAFAAPASAHGFRGRPFHDGHPGRPQPPANAQCQKNCRQLEHLCVDSAWSDLQACGASTCSAERQAVHDACSTKYDSDACRTARTALQTCLQPCRSTFTTAAGGCRSSRQTCTSTCGTAVPTQPDPQCVAGCRASLQTCQLTASTADRGCFADCTPLIATAQQTCQADPSASACTTALQAAQACVQGCNQAERAALQACVQTEQSCFAGCPSVSPTPSPSPGT